MFSWAAVRGVKEGREPQHAQHISGRAQAILTPTLCLFLLGSCSAPEKSSFYCSRGAATEYSYPSANEFIPVGTETHCSWMILGCFLAAPVLNLGKGFCTLRVYLAALWVILRNSSLGFRAGCSQIASFLAQPAAHSFAMGFPSTAAVHSIEVGQLCCLSS